MKMGRSIYTVERSKAVLWMYLSNIYIYICILLYVFLSTFLSHTYNTALSGELNYPEFFSTQIAFFLFARNFFFPFLLPSNRRIFISAHPRVSHSNPRIRSFSTRRKVSFAIYWNFSLALEEIFTKDRNIIKEKLSMHEIRWKRYEIEFQQLSYWDFFFFLNDYSWTCLVASDIQMRFQIRNGPWILFDFIFPFQCILCQFDF